MTLLETAKRNGLDSEKYINYLLMNLANEDKWYSRGLFAMDENIKKTCK